MALGADAVYLGTTAVMATVGDQLTKAVPFEAPTDLAVYQAKMTEKLDVERGAQNLANFLNASVREMELVAYSLGKTNLSDINRSDLCTLDPFLSKATGVDLGYISHTEQPSYFQTLFQPELLAEQRNREGIHGMGNPSFEQPGTEKEPPPPLH